MFSFLRRYKIAIIVLILGVAGYMVYPSLFSDDESQLTVVSESGDEVIGSVAGREIIVLLDELQDINIDGAIFDDPAFQSLIDFEQEVLPEPVGRDNPFTEFGSP